MWPDRTRGSGFASVEIWRTCPDKLIGEKAALRDLELQKQREQHVRHKKQAAGLRPLAYKQGWHIISTNKKIGEIMNRKQFIESNGATCKNWTWSWSFVNHAERFVIFGLWESDQPKKYRPFLHKEWQFSAKGNRQPGYTQAIEHVRLIQEENYSLRTFPMRGSRRFPEQGELSPALIEDFTPVLSDSRIKELPDGWYVEATEDDDSLPEEIYASEDSEGYVEGAPVTVTINAYERNPKARAKCLKHWGYTCQVCEMEFGKLYGEIGNNYIHVHHIVPIAKTKKEYIVDPIKDLVPVCPNCHSMLHRTSDTLTVEALKKIMVDWKSAETEKSAGSDEHTTLKHKEAGHV